MRTVVVSKFEQNVLKELASQPDTHVLCRAKSEKGVSNQVRLLDDEISQSIGLPQCSDPAFVVPGGFFRL